MFELLALCLRPERTYIPGCPQGELLCALGPSPTAENLAWAEDGWACTNLPHCLACKRGRERFAELAGGGLPEDLVLRTLEAFSHVGDMRESRFPPFCPDAPRRPGPHPCRTRRTCLECDVGQEFVPLVLFDILEQGWGCTAGAWVLL